MRPNPDAGVRHANAHHAGVGLARDGDAATVGRELDRVRDEIQQDLLKAVGVRGHDNAARARRHGQGQRFGFRLEGAQSLDFGEHRIDLERDQSKRRRPLDFRDRENIVYQAQEESRPRA